MPESFNGTGKLGPSENLTKAANINNYEFVSVDVSGASGTVPTGDLATVCSRTADSNYRYEEKMLQILQCTIMKTVQLMNYIPHRQGSRTSEVTRGCRKTRIDETTNQVANFEYVA